MSQRVGPRRALVERALALGLVAALVLLPACDSGSDGPVDGALAVITGQETDTWTQTPVAQSVWVELVGTDRTTLATLAAPITTVSLGQGAQAESPASLEVTAFDADNNAVIHGATIPLALGTFEGAEPTVFVGRTGGFSRAPGDLVFEYRHPLLEVVSDALVIVAGGDVTNSSQVSVDVYDMYYWVAAQQQSWLARIPKSWAVSGTNLLVIDDYGPVWVDLTTGDGSPVTLPIGLAFTDVVGGQTFVDANDTRYIVGATRTTGDPTDQVLRVGTDGTLSALTLSSPRLGAAAAIVNGQLVVAAGSASAVGAEMLNADETAFVPLAYPSDATQGAALTQLTSTSALVVGGIDPATSVQAGLRTLDLTCTASCNQTPLADVDFGYSDVAAFNLADNQALLVGESADGQTHAFTLDTTTSDQLSEVPLRVPRIAASAALLPNGQIGVFGGDAVADGSPATSVELFFPAQ